MGKKKRNSIADPKIAGELTDVLRNLAEKSGADPDQNTQSLISQAHTLFEKEADLWESDPNGFLSFLQNNGLVLTENDYLRAAVVGLSLVHRLKSTHYGTSQQRDFGQKWVNLIAGLLGEIAFTKIVSLKTHGRIVPLPDASKLELEEALSGDIKELLINGTEKKPPKKSVSIKTTKLNGYWLDIPYAQIKRSGLFVLVKVGVDQNSLFEFFSRQKVWRHLLNKYKDLIQNELFASEHKEVSDAEKLIEEAGGPIVYLAVVSGWQKGEELDKTFKAMKYRKTRKYLSVFEGLGIITTGKGLSSKDIHLNSPEDQKEDLKVKFKPIEEFSSSAHTLCSIGCLKRSLDELIEELI